MDKLIERTKEIIYIARDDSFSLNYTFGNIPYHRVLKQEIISIDFDQFKINEHEDLMTYLGLAKYVNNDHLKVSIDDLKNDEDFFYRWIIDKGNLVK